MPGDLCNFQDLRAAALREKRQVQEREGYRAVRQLKRSTISQGGESGGRAGKKRRYDSTVQTQPICAHCRRRHLGECRKLSGACFRCGEQGHFHRACPRQKDSDSIVSELTVQYLRQGGPETTPGRGGSRKTAVPDVDKGKILSS